MKRFLLLTAVIFAICINAHAQQTVKDTTLVIKFESLIHDYGTVTQGGDGNCEFSFINEGKTPLILNSVTASCGCTVPQWTNEPVAPGKNGTIKVRYNTNNIGTFAKVITVNSNAKNSPIQLTIKGKVTPKQN